MAVQPFLGPWPPWTSDQPVARPLLIHRITQTQKNAQTYKQPCLSRIRTYDHGIRASEDSSCLRPLGYRDRLSGCIHFCNCLRPGVSSSPLHPSISFCTLFSNTVTVHSSLHARNQSSQANKNVHTFTRFYAQNEKTKRP
jgi:hypothetical protein